MSGAAAVGIDIGGSSIKAAAMNDSGEWQTCNNSRYTNPSRDELGAAIRGCLAELKVVGADRVGLCLPGKMNPDATAIQWSANIPALDGWMFADLLGSCFEKVPARSRIVSDADAAGYDWVSEHPFDGRTAAVSLGTGVGLCVLDGDRSVGIGEGGIGHLGHMDVGCHGGMDRVDRSGARNTLESYIGAPSLMPWMGAGGLDLSGLTIDDPPIGALVQALRVVHAIYQPERVVLLGGVGLALMPLLGMIADGINEGLTPLAHEGWKLSSSDSNYHAARGAAKLVAQDF